MESVKDRTELVCIIDKSGSMSGYEDDTIGGFNSFIRKQKELPGECHVTTILFDDSLYLLHDRVDIRAMKKLTSHDYVAGGCTALLDAVGMGIDKTVKYVKSIHPKYAPDHVIFFITTDGMENASTHYSGQKIRHMISTEKEKYHWDFIFSGAGIDVKETAREMNIDEDKAYSYERTPKGIARNLECACAMVSGCRRIRRRK